LIETEPLLVDFRTEILRQLEALHNYAYYLTNDETLAADLVQDTYLRVLKNEQDFKTGSNLKAWMFTILRNCFINEYRRKKRWRDTPLSGTEQGGSTDDEDDYEPEQFTAPIGQVTSNELGDEITRALESLSNDERSLILLSDLEDFSYEEMSQILNVPIGTVRSRLHRARVKLKGKLKKYALTQGIEPK
jgi:RNA polymerase sigma factor (sigma-70 family)